MTMSETLELTIHKALIACEYKCQGILKKNIIEHTETLCPEVHGQHAKNYKGRVILQAHIVKSKIDMLCWVCLQKAVALKKTKARTRKKKKVDPDQVDLLGFVDEKKHPGPKNVPETSIEAFIESRDNSKSGAIRAYNLVRKSPNKTAYELFSMTNDFENIFVLRRHLSDLKADNKVFNPGEKICSFNNRKMFTWSIK